MEIHRDKLTSRIVRGAIPQILLRLYAFQCTIFVASQISRDSEIAEGSPALIFNDGELSMHLRSYSAMHHDDTEYARSLPSVGYETIRTTLTNSSMRGEPRGITRNQLNTNLPMAVIVLIINLLYI